MPPKLASKDEHYVPPLQQRRPEKRIRVARACDLCRKRKVKCDGKQPCIHCTVYSYKCSYNQGSVPVAPQETIQPSSGQQQMPSSDSESTLKALLDSNIDINRLLAEHYSPGVPQIKIILPPREVALQLIYKTWSDSCVLFRFYHRPSFIRDFNSLYETPPENYTDHQSRILPLIYSVIAVGALFSKGDNAIDNQYLQDEGYRYFLAARKLIDITNTSDLESIQTIFMLTLFLQCSARLSTCYSYIGIALRSALRQGLHRKIDQGNNNIRAECTKRLFWTIYKLEIYVNSILGLPHSVDEDDIETDFPLDLDDVNIESMLIKPQQQGKLSSCGVNNSHTRLILILNHIVKKIYKTSNPTYMIPQDVFKSLENELKLWKYELPKQLQFDNASIPGEYVKANRLLYLDYLHVQITLYRPFVHFAKLAKLNKDTETTNFQVRAGFKCFDIAKQSVRLARSMIRDKLLNGNYWFSIYTIFFSVACLVYYFLEIDSLDIEVKQAIDIGKEILLGLKQRSVGAERIYNLLNHMFENYDRQNIRQNIGLDQSSRPAAPSAAPAAPAPAATTPQSSGGVKKDEFDIFSAFLPGFMLENPGSEEGWELEHKSPHVIRNDEHEHEFDWDRFIDRDVVNFDV